MVRKNWNANLAVSMIDPATGWFKLKEISSKSANNVANVIEQTWLTQYPYPSVITYDRGGEFMV